MGANELDACSRNLERQLEWQSPEFIPLQVKMKGLGGGGVRKKGKRGRERKSKGEEHREGERGGERMENQKRRRKKGRTGKGRKSMNKHVSFPKYE